MFKVNKKDASRTTLPAGIKSYPGCSVVVFYALRCSEVLRGAVSAPSLLRIVLLVLRSSTLVLC